MSFKSNEYTCIFGGGGLSYIGAIQALKELDISINTIAGSSVGAIFSGLLAVGYDAEEIEKMFLKINFDLFRDIHFGFGKAFALSKGEVFLEWLREMIESRFYGENYSKGKNPTVKFKDIEKDLVIITTDLTNFKCKEFSKKETPDFEIATAIRISSSMPGLMTPIFYENAELVDGDLQKSWPLWKLSDTLDNSNLFKEWLDNYDNYEITNDVYNKLTSNIPEELKELKDGITGIYNNMNALEIINKHELEVIEEI